MKEAIAVYDISAQELGLGTGWRQVAGRASSKKKPARKSKTTKQAAPRSAYADGNGNTWGGRGPRPKWLKDALAGGARLEDFAQK
jgi:DNA-binding protein H-NS